MLTFVLIITLTNFHIILGTENNDTAFINSLPEQQKKEFLQKVEKRIQNEVPEVKSPELNDTNVELYEKHLQDQGKSIQKILRSEIDSLKTHHRRNSNDSERRDEHIDLTLRTLSNKPGTTRRKIEGNGIVKEELNIPVVVQYDSIDENKQENTSRNMATKMQNRNTNNDKNGPNVDEITWENISLATNESSIERKRTGRRSNDFDTTFNEFDNATVVKPESDANSSLDSINDTTTVSTKSYNVDSANTTKYPSEESSKLEIVNSTAQNVDFDTVPLILKNTQDEPKTTSSTHDKVNTMNEEVTVTNSTSETNSSSTPKFLRAKPDDNIDNITQYNQNTKTNDKFGTAPYYFDEKVRNTSTIIYDEKVRNTSTIIDVTEHNLDIGSTTLDTTTNKSRPGSDPDERPPHYVPVHNYDPENAYFNSNSQQQQADGNVTGENMPYIINSNKTHSESNKKERSLSIMDVKDRIILINNITQNSDIYDISDGSRESSREDVMFEKPLKHTLKKIRTKLYKNKVNNKSKDDINTIKAETKAEDDSSPYYTNQYNIYIRNVTDLFKNFGYLLQNLVKESKNNETQLSESKGQFYKDTSDLNIGIVKNIINKLEDLKKVLKKTDTTKTIKKVRSKPENKILKQSKEKLSGKEYQSRFHIKDRNENYKQKQDQIYTSFGHGDIAGTQVEYRNQQFEKSGTEINDEYLETHLNILKELVYSNDVGLEQYDWLGTTVLIRSGLTKLQEITGRKINRKKLHHLDQKLLEFAMELYEIAKTLIAKQNLEPIASFRRKQRVSFRIPKKGKKINSLNRMYSELKNTRTARNRRSRHSLEDFKEFLNCLEICLNDLHNAIKQVSQVTTYKKQRWFKNIKQLYLKPDKDKEYLELLLHLVTTRLISLVDEREKKVNPDEDYMKDKVAVDRIEVEFMMVLRICNKLMELSDS